MVLLQKYRSSKHPRKCVKSQFGWPRTANCENLKFHDEKFLSLSDIPMELKYHHDKQPI